MRPRKKEDADAELAEMFSSRREDWREFLERILRRMEDVSPDRRRDVAAFRRYYGIEGRTPMLLADISKLFGYQRSWAGGAIKKVTRRLSESRWWDESRWPEPFLKRTSSKMRPERIAEIAILLQMWRQESTGLRPYMNELKYACEELGITDKEMSQFYHAIEERLKQRK